jgi:hypothetical protein
MTLLRQVAASSKVAHTVHLGVVRACIDRHSAAGVARSRSAGVALILCVLIEVLVLIANGGHCRSRAVAARYTTDRRDNFDIYLPAMAGSATINSSSGRSTCSGSQSSSLAGIADDCLLEARGAGPADTGLSGCVTSVAGLVVGVVALPLAMAFAIA